jgi:hypothetical protein
MQSDTWYDLAVRELSILTDPATERFGAKTRPRSLVPDQAPVLGPEEKPEPARGTTYDA